MRIEGIDGANDNLLNRMAPAAPPAATAAAPHPASSSAGSASAAPSDALAGDSANISPLAALVARTMSLPDEDSARVGPVRDALAAGHYGVDSGQTASALIHAMLNPTLEGHWS